MPTIKLTNVLYPKEEHCGVLVEAMSQDDEPEPQERKKGVWLTLLSRGAKEELVDELIKVVNTAYATTTHGSFIKTLNDVVASDWQALDWDEDPEVDVAIFWRNPRSGDSWTGKKLQGVGHDGQRKSKDILIVKMKELLRQPGWWSESGGAVRKIFLRDGDVPVVKDVNLIKALFPNTNVQMIDEHTYTRELPNGQVITESVFGNPVVPGYKG